MPSQSCSPVAEAEIGIVTDFIRSFREHYSKTQAISAATVALGLPALGQHERIGVVLDEMRSRGLLTVDHYIRGHGAFPDEPAYREAMLP